MYSTIDDLKKLIPEETLIQLTDDEGKGVVVVTRAEEAIAQADGEIDSYCAVKYAVPLVPVPGIVKKCSVDMALYNLYSRRVEEIPSTRADRYRNAVRLLEGIVKGTVSLGEVPGAEAPRQGDWIESTREESERTVTRSRLEGF